MFKNVASQKLTVFAFDSTTNLPKTGDAANITAYVDKDDGGVTVLGDTSATEKDSTNAKGYYIFDLTQAETNGDKLLFSAKSSTSNIVVIAVPAIVYTVPPNFTALSIDSSGRGDIIKINGTSQTAKDLGAINVTNLNTLSGHDPGAPLGTSTLTAAQAATAVWTDTTSGDFTVALSIGKSIMNGVSLGTGLKVDDLSKINGVSAASITAINANLGTSQPINFTGTSGSALVKSDATAISTDTTAADNLEAALDGTGGVDLTLRQLRMVATDRPGFYCESSAAAGYAMQINATDADGTGLYVYGGSSGVLAFGNAASGVYFQGGNCGMGLDGGIHGDLQLVNSSLKWGSTSQTSVNTVDGKADAIQAKTDNLPASPAAVGSAMTLTSAYDAAKTALGATVFTDMTSGTGTSRKFTTTALSNAPTGSGGSGGVAGPGNVDVQLPVFQTSGGDPIPDMSVWLTSDIEGTDTVAGTKTTDDNGLVSFLLDEGDTYYIWARKAGYTEVRAQAGTVTDGVWVEG